MLDLTARVSAESVEDLLDGLEALTRDLRREQAQRDGGGTMSLSRKHPVVYSFSVRGQPATEDLVHVLTGEADDAVRSYTVVDFIAAFLKGYPLSLKQTTALLEDLSGENDMDEAETREWVQRWVNTHTGDKTDA